MKEHPIHTDYSITIDGQVWSKKRWKNWRLEIPDVWYDWMGNEHDNALFKSL